MSAYRQKILPNIQPYYFLKKAGKIMSTQPQPRNSQKHKLKIVLRIFLGIFAIAVIAIVTVLITPTILSFRNEETRQKFIEYIDGFGIWGVVVMMAI